MEKNSRYFIVGLFVSITLVAGAMFVIWLAGTHDSRNYQRLTIYFRDPVSGLKNSAAVQYRGVDVGRVRDIRIAPGAKELIKVDIEIDDATPITQSTEASLATQGITGLAYIELTTKEGPQSPPLKVAGERYPVINGRGTQLSKLFQDIPKITERILTLTERLNNVFNDDNMASLDQTMANIAQSTQDLNDLLSDENIQNTTVAIRNVSQSTERVDELIARFDQTADKIDEAVGSLNGVLTDNKANIDKFAGSGLKEITQMTAETREMAKSIRRLADTLDQDPSRLLYQPNYRGVEIQK